MPLADVGREGNTDGIPQTVVVEELLIPPVDVQLVRVVLDQLWRFKPQRVDSDGFDLDDGFVLIQSVGLSSHVQALASEWYLVIAECPSPDPALRALLR